MNRGVIDKGNTRLKVGIFNSKNELIRTETLEKIEQC
jgi:pantothenate kinase type III